MTLLVNLAGLLGLGFLAWLFVRLGREPRDSAPRPQRGRTRRGGPGGGRPASLLVAGGLLIAAPVLGELPGETAAGAPGALPNERCPVLTDEPANPAFHATHEGRDVYFCCAACRRKFLADPRRYLANLPQFGGAPPLPGTATAATAVGHPPPATLLAALGRFHPVVLHLPIALLLAALGAELLAVFAGWRAAHLAVPFLVLAAAPASVVTALLGLALASGTTAPPGLEGTLALHRAAGLACAGFSLLLALALPWRAAPGARRALFVALLAVAAASVAVAGHWGAVLVWGPDWLPM